MFASLLVASVTSVGWSQLPAAHPLRALALVDVPRGGGWSVAVTVSQDRLRVLGQLPSTKVAAAKLETRVNDHPDDADALTELADYRQVLGEPGAATAIRERVVALRRMAVVATPSAETRSALAQALLRAGHPIEARAEAKRATDQHPAAFVAWVARAWVANETADPAIDEALAQLRKLLPANSTDERIGLALLTVMTAQRRAAEPVQQAGARADMAAALADAEAAIKAAVTAGPAADRPAAERRLALLVARDMLRAMTRDPKDPPGPTVATDTLVQIRGLVPADVADPVVPFIAIWAERMAVSAHPLRDDPATRPILNGAMVPYRDALERLGKSEDAATAATALFFRAISMILPLSDPTTAPDEVRTDLREAVKREPTFDMAWSALVMIAKPDDRTAVATDWVRASGSPLSRYLLAREQVEERNWAAAEATIDAGMPADKRHPVNPRLALSKAACLLRKGPAGAVAAGELLRQVAQAGTAPEWDIVASHARLAALACVLTRNLDQGKPYAATYTRLTAGRPAAADAAKLQALYGP